LSLHNRSSRVAPPPFKAEPARSKGVPLNFQPFCRSLRLPISTGLMALALAMTSAVGITRIRMDDSLSQLSHSDTPEIQTLSTGDAQVSLQ
jgi:hypothetical protein